MDECVQQGNISTTKPSIFAVDVALLLAYDHGCEGLGFKLSGLRLLLLTAYYHVLGIQHLDYRHPKAASSTF